MARKKAVAAPVGTAGWDSNFVTFEWGGGRTPSWFGIGTDVEGAVTGQDAIRRAGLDWDIALEPLYREVRDGEFAPQRGIVSVVRTDSNGVLGFVGPDYGVLQNRDAFAVLDPLVDQGKARYVRAGELRGGRDVYVQVAFNITDPVVQEVYGELGLIPFGTYTNNNTGARQAVLGDSPIAIVCANTFAAATVQLTSVGNAIRHTRNAGVRLVELAQRVWGGIIERNRVLAETYRTLRTTKLDEETFMELIGTNVLGPAPKEDSKEHVLERYQERKTGLLGLWRGDALGVTGKETAYEGWMAATEALDHDPKGLFRESKDLVAVTIGSRAQRKVEVWSALSRYVEE